MFRPTLTLTVHNARSALNAGLEAIAGGQGEIDLAQLTAVDSAAVATLLAWQRAAAASGRKLVFTNPPQNLQSLSKLYGVTELLNLSATPPHRHPGTTPA